MGTESSGGGGDHVHLRGGSDSSRLRGDRHVTINLTPAEYDSLWDAAEARDRTLKSFCRTAVLAALGLPDDRPDFGRGGNRRGRKGGE